MTTDAVIRPATPKDVPTILAMMQGTAADQHSSGAVTATESDLLQTLSFASEPTPSNSARGKCLVAVASDGEIAGMAMYCLIYTTWYAKPGIYVEDFFVFPQYRRRGYAKQLVQAVAIEANTLGCSRVDWFCYKDNERAMSLYHKIGAQEKKEFAVFRLGEEKLAQFAREVR